MQDLEALTLLKKYLAGQCSPQEQAILETWYLKYYQRDLPELSEASRLKLRQEVWSALPVHEETEQEVPVHKLRIWPRIASVAAVVLVIGGGLFYYNRADMDKDPQQVAFVKDIAPGTNKATLTLANGKVINLSDAKTGIAVNDSSLTYNDGTEVRDSAISQPVLTSGQNLPKAGQGPGLATNTKLITASTPRGGIYQVILSDGTHIYLNAASSIKFPETFAGLKERRIELRGEAYFEVAKDKHKPFTVSSSGQKVTVLGTHFNISNYAQDRMIRTTLLEGSVRIVMGGRHPNAGQDDVVLKPGQLAINTARGIKVEQANMKLETAWMKNDFYFRGESLGNVMQEIARWYDIQVIYTDEGIKTVPLIGQISRTRTLSAVLERIVTAGHVRFSIEGRKVTVMPGIEK